MKRILMVVLMVLSFNLFGIDHGLISGFEVGWNIGELHNIANKEIYRENDLSIKMTTGYRIENLRIIGIYENTLEQVKIDSYNPLQDKFTINISYTINNFEFGFSHMCTHPTIPQNDSRDSFYNGGKRFVYVRWYKEF